MCTRYPGTLLLMGLVERHFATHIRGVKKSVLVIR